MMPGALISGAAGAGWGSAGSGSCRAVHGAVTPGADTPKPINASSYTDEGLSLDMQFVVCQQVGSPAEESFPRGGTRLPRGPCGHTGH